MKHPFLITLFLIASFGVVGFGYSFWGAKKKVSPTEVSVESMPGSTVDESALSSIPSETENSDVGSDAEAIEKLMAEIEKTATGDENALESEYAAESESFMEGVVVMEQLGTSYDETSY